MAVVLGLAFLSFSFFFFFNDTATTEIYTLSLHDALPISVRVARVATGRSKVVKFEGHFHGVHDGRSEEHTSELQSRLHLVCRLLLEKKKKNQPRGLIPDNRLCNVGQYVMYTALQPVLDCT